MEILLYISHASIKGFRNFKDSEINLNEKTLVIGANDIGKSNLIYALRILLDKKLSEAEKMTFRKLNLGFI